MDIKSFGCSFIFGSELSDDGRNGPYATGSRLTWPALLAKHYGYGYHTYARPGSGNLQILEKIYNHATNIAPAMYVIGWTWIDRFDYIDSNGPVWRKLDNHNWSTIMPIDQTDLAETYYKHLHSEYQDKLTNLLYIKSAIDLLTSKNHKFIMTYMDNLLFDTAHNCDPAILELQEYIRPYMTRFDNMNFLEWSKSRGYPIGTAAHPLEQAHAAAADYMLELGVYKE
jgi:hypothetical protein